MMTFPYYKYILRIHVQYLMFSFWMMYFLYTALVQDLMFSFRMMYFLYTSLIQDLMFSFGWYLVYSLDQDLIFPFQRMMMVRIKSCFPSGYSHCVSHNIPCLSTSGRWCRWTSSNIHLWSRHMGLMQDLIFPVYMYGSGSNIPSINVWFRI